MYNKVVKKRFHGILGLTIHIIFEWKSPNNGKQRFLERWLSLSLRLLQKQ